MVALLAAKAYWAGRFLIGSAPAGWEDALCWKMDLQDLVTFGDLHATIDEGSVS